MTTIIFNHEKSSFSKLTLTHMVKLNDIKGEGFTHNTFQHFIIQLLMISPKWPRNPHDCSQSQPKLPPHTTLTTKNLKTLISSSSSHPTTNSISISQA